MSSVNNPFFQPAKNPTTPKSTTTTSTTTTTSPALTSSSPTKRPYIRVKRPKNYNDKSTITQTTEAVTQQNAFNSILDEADNLCQAAAEAQQLGRLQMASTYLLLLHARLVGLGKRFDKAYQGTESSKSTSEQALPKQLDFGHLDVPVDDEQVRKVEDKQPTIVTAEAMEPVKDTPPVEVQQPQQQHQQNTSEDASQIFDSSNSSFLFSPPRPKKALQDKEPPESATPKTAAARQLASMLPQNIELDSAMMEHLAKAAAELHAARSNRKRPLFASVQPSMPADRVDWELPGVDRVRKPVYNTMINK